MQKKKLVFIFTMLIGMHLSCTRDDGTGAVPDLATALVGSYTIRNITINSTLYSQTYLQENPPTQSFASVIKVDNNTIILSYSHSMNVRTVQGLVLLQGSKTAKMTVEKVSDIEYTLRSADNNDFGGTFYNTILTVGNGTDGISAALKK
jgi:hypothetical protein